MDQNGDGQAIWARLRVPGIRPGPHPAGQPVGTRRREGPTTARDHTRSASPAPRPLLTSHGWQEVGGVMTCEDPAKCGTGISQGPAALVHL